MKIRIPRGTMIAQGDHYMLELITGKQFCVQFLSANIVFDIVPSSSWAKHRSFSFAFADFGEDMARKRFEATWRRNTGYEWRSFVLAFSRCQKRREQSEEYMTEQYIQAAADDGPYGRIV